MNYQGFIQEKGKVLSLCHCHASEDIRNDVCISTERIAETNPIYLFCSYEETPVVHLVN